MLARSGSIPARGAWAFEVKWDGFRAIVRTDGDFRVRSRRGWNMTEFVPELERLPTPGIFDGELVSFDRKGRPDFPAVVGRKMIQAAGRKIDAGLLNGAVKGPSGVLNYPHLPSISGPVSYDSLVEAAATIREAGGDPQWAAISPSSLSNLQKETDGLNRPLLSNDPQAGPVYTVAGLKLLVSPAFAAGGGLVFDAAQFPTAIPKDVTLEVDTSVKFDSDQLAIRVKARVDAAVADPNGFCGIQPS
jgi:HK97 family phage major capsid protein